MRLLRMITFYVCILLREQKGKVSVHVSVLETNDSCQIKVGNNQLNLKVTPSENLVPLTPRVFDQRTIAIMEKVEVQTIAVRDELSIILDLWLSKTLAPAVILSNDQSKTLCIVESLKFLDDIHTLGNIDTSRYKMMKSLYDPNDTPNLRDDILKLGHGAFVAVGLICETLDAQLCIREIIEDTPSMTAFSTERSALHKAGLLFCIFVNGDITPEIRSRASLVI